MICLLFRKGIILSGCYYLVLLAIISCNNATTDAKSKLPGVADTTGFFSDCPNVINNAFSGYLQGVEAEKDSLGLFCFYECYGCKETYKIVFAYNDINERRQPGSDTVWSALQRGCKDYFKDFACFAFVYPMRDPDKQKDVHALNFDFPLVVRVYERLSDDNWKYIKTVKVKTFPGFGLLQFKTIYHLD